ncbi:MAG: 3'-5' exonuclease [Clostridia bacterium]|nr:3'-5' exonuclease [Clostridia bacterium]
METLSPQLKKTPPCISRRDAERRSLLTEEELLKMHLQPTADPVACITKSDGTVVYYYNPNKVKEAPPAHWYERPTAPKRELPAEPEAVTVSTEAGELRRISGRRAELLGYFSAEALFRMYYEPVEPPVACLVRKSGEVVLLYDKATCRRLPLPCVKCGNASRYRSKLCYDCYSEELAERRAKGDAKRAKKYGNDPKRVLFFDLELTGVFERDEILSVSIINGLGEVVFDSYTRPVRNRKWNRTEKIHGITPAMVQDAPTLAEIAPHLRDIVDGADRMIAYGTSTDYSHLRKIYSTKTERNQLKDKLVDCAAEFSRFVVEHEIALSHHSLTDAMAHFNLDWNGIAHTSAADAQACRLVFEALFPHYYESEDA